MQRPHSPAVQLFTKKGLSMMSLVIITIVSAVLVIYTKHSARMLHATLTNLQSQRDVLNTEWSQLLLEQSIWGSGVRIEQVAFEKLNMYIPELKESLVIKNAK